MATKASPSVWPGWASGRLPRRDLPARISAVALARLPTRPRSTSATSALLLRARALRTSISQPRKAAVRQQALAAVEAPVHRNGDEGEPEGEADPHADAAEAERKGQRQRGDDADRPVAAEGPPHRHRGVLQAAQHVAIGRASRR